MVATLFEWFYGKSPSDKIFIFGKWAQNGRALGCLRVGEDVSKIARPLALSALPQDNDVCVKSFTTLLSPTTGPLGRDPCARWDTPGVSCQVVCVHLHNLRSHSIQRAAPSESA